MKCLPKTFQVAILAFAIAGSARAAGAPALDERGIQQAAATERAAEPGDGPSDSKIESPRALVEVSAGRAGNTAVVKYGRTLNFFGSHDGNGGRLGWHAATLSFSTPFGSGAEDAELATLDGLHDSRTVGIKLARSVQSVKAGGEADFRALCSDFRNRAVALGRELATCSTGNILEALGREAAIEWDRALFTGPTWTYGIEGEVGHKSFVWLESDLATRSRGDETPWAAAAFVGVLAPRNVLLTLGYRYENSFRESARKMLCAPTARPPILECEGKAIGAPKRSTGNQAFFALRGRASMLGYEARVTHDFADDDTGLSLPVYFMRDSNDRLTGGLRLGWTDKSRDVTAVVFVGTAFNVTD